MKKFLLLLSVFLLTSALGRAETYKLIKSETDLVAGEAYVIAGIYETTWYGLGYQKDNNRDAVAITVNNEQFTSTSVYPVVLGGKSGSWTFRDRKSDKYLYAASSKNNSLKSQANITDDAKFSIAISSDGVASIQATGTNTYNIMQFYANVSNKLFNCYEKVSQKPVYLYKVVPPIEVSGDLDKILNNGVESESYKINEPLIGILAVGNVLYVKTDDNTKCSNISTPSHEGLDAYEDDVNDFEQRDWLALEMENEATANGLVGKVISSGLIGTFGGATTPQLVVTFLPTYIDNPNTEDQNLYQVHNFIAAAYVNPDNGYAPFWVEPKLNEIAIVAGFIRKVGETYYLYDNNLDDNKRVKIDNSKNVALEEVERGHYRKFEAAIMRGIIVDGVTAKARALPTGYEYIIKALTNSAITTGIEGTVADKENSIRVIGRNGILKFEGIDGNGVDAIIFDATGRVINKSTVADGETIAIAPGYYIVKIGTKVVKVIL